MSIFNYFHAFHSNCTRPAPKPRGNANQILVFLENKLGEGEATHFISVSLSKLKNMNCNWCPSFRNYLFDMVYHSKTKTRAAGCSHGVANPLSANVSTPHIPNRAPGKTIAFPAYRHPH
jgi:hypothetical protein